MVGGPGNTPVKGSLGSGNRPPPKFLRQHWLRHRSGEGSMLSQKTGRGDLARAQAKLSDAQLSTGVSEGTQHIAQPSVTQFPHLYDSEGVWLFQLLCSLTLQSRPCWQTIACRPNQVHSCFCMA